jgi:hyperosmotically inducible periplasmic protein
MEDKSLSTYAHNVKIITQNGMVTLKGPVRSEDEKKAIEAKAAEVAGGDKVTNEMDIKPKQ